jgi:hypothetical protein
MLKNAELVKEISVVLDNEIGLLNRMSGLLADHGINIEAMAGYEMQEANKARIMLVVDDTRRAGDALKAKGYGSVDERDVILVELDNKPGALKSVTSQLVHKDIDIKYIYGTTTTEECPVRIVLSTSDNEKAFVTLKKSSTL